MKTYSPKASEIQHKWYVVDAAGKVLGRLATEIARRLRGKHKPEYTPHADMGDYIIVINADKVCVTGKKAQDKVYYRHTGYPGGLKSINYEKLMQRNPTCALETAVKGMMPKNSLGRAMYGKLRVYSGEAHHHMAQQPEVLELKEVSSE